MNDELWSWSAGRTAAAIRSGDISSEEAVTAALSRLEATNGTTNAFCEVFDDAVKQAREADGARSRGDVLGALHGVPVAVKPNTDLEGYPTHDGVEEYLAHPAGETSPAIHNLLQAGAVPVGRTNVPSFSVRWFSDNEHWGRTLNPWDPEVTPGGSSGGAASAVASGVVALAQGNDLAGSVRYPAAACGVVGLRPTSGRIPSWHGRPGGGTPLTITQFGVEGPIARTVDDLRLALSVMERFDPRDPIAAPQTVKGRPVDGARPRIAVVTDPGSSPYAGPGLPETTDATRTVAAALADAGYDVEEVELPLLAEASMLWFQFVLTELRALGAVGEIQRVREQQTQRSIDLWCEIHDDVFGDVSLTQFLQGYDRRHYLRRQLAEFMEDFPVLLLPNSGEPPFPHGDDLVSADRTREILRHQWPNTAIPVLGLPGIGMGVIRRENKAPLGVQLVGRSFDEELLLRTAKDVEARFDVSLPIDPRTPAAPVQ